MKHRYVPSMTGGALSVQLASSGTMQHSRQAVHLRKRAAGAGISNCGINRLHTNHTGTEWIAAQGRRTPRKQTALFRRLRSSCGGNTNTIACRCLPNTVLAKIQGKGGMTYLPPLLGMRHAKHTGPLHYVPHVRGRVLCVCVCGGWVGGGGSLLLSIHSQRTCACACQELQT